MTTNTPRSLRNAYVSFDTMEDFATLMERYAQLGWSYKNGTYDDATEVVRNSAVDKITCKDGFVFTSKHKNNVISFDMFMELTENLNTTPVVTTTEEVANPATRMLNKIKGEKFFSNEKKVQGVVDIIESISALTSNFEATMRKAQDKNNRLIALNNQLATAFERQDVLNVEKLMKLATSASKYITETNKVLSSINETGATIVASETKASKDVDGAGFIGQ